MKSRTRSLLFFYLFVIYVFASFIWWSYLLLEKNAEAFEERIQIEKTSFNSMHGLSDSAPEYLQTTAYQVIHERYLRQKLMIIGEGLVFLLLLAAGCIRLWYAFKKEIALARQQNNFLLSITHELKSPLASVKLSLQTIIKRVSLEDTFRKLAENSVEDVDRLNELVDNILYAARMEDASFILQKEEINISEITVAIVQKIAAANSDTAHISTDITENILLKTDKGAFTSLLQNLMENAIKYSLAPAKVKIILRKTRTTVRLQVADNGIGIPETERSAVFQKFYRIGNEETRNTKGTGIGLYLVKKIVEMHNGKITIDENIPSGTNMIIEFPDEQG